MTALDASHRGPRERDPFHRDIFKDFDPRVFVSDPDEPEEGRTFVWSLTRWFERVEGETGAVEFTPVAEDEKELREWLFEQDIELTEIDNGFALEVCEEFLEQSPLYPEAPELSDQELAE